MLAEQTGDLLLQLPRQLRTLCSRPSHHQVSGHSKYPLAGDPNRVGTYPPDTESGTGYFYDEVHEYRVWFNPANGDEPLNGKNDNFVAFAQYGAADAFSKKTHGVEAPLVLVRQLEWISEPKGGHSSREGERSISPT
jgi:hypothetical protein